MPRAPGQHGGGNGSSSGSTAVLAAAAGYPFQRWASFLQPLRAVYAGDVLVTTPRDEQLSPEIRSLVAQARVKLVHATGLACEAAYETRNAAATCASMALARFAWLARQCRRYEVCFSVDFRDCVFQADPFKSLYWRGTRYAGPQLVLSLEDPSTGLQRSWFNFWWVTKCYGRESHRTTFHGKQVINSGTIFGTAKGFDALAAGLATPCTASNESFHGVDQVKLNWLVYSGRFAAMRLSYRLQQRGYGIVNTLRYATQKTRESRIAKVPEERWLARWPNELPFTVRNEDGTLSPVVHQFGHDVLGLGDG